MKKLLAILAVIAVFVTVSEAADYSCDVSKPGLVPCLGCVFLSGDMEGKCKLTGQYFEQSACEAAGGTWCTLRLKFHCSSVLF